MRTLGKGTYGHVVECQSKKSGKSRAIKHMFGFSNSQYNCTQVIREVQILRAIQDQKCDVVNGFFGKLYEVIIPEE